MKLPNPLLLLSALACLVLAACGDDIQPTADDAGPQEPSPPPPGPRVPGPGDDLEAAMSSLSAVVGNHRAIGSYTCRIPTGGTITFSVVTQLYLAQTTVAGRWSLYLSNVVGTGAGITLNIRDTSPLEAADNGFAIYNTPQDTVYVHRLTPFAAIEYTHDEYVHPYDIQVWPASLGHPLGQLVLGLYPQGNSDVQKGECPDPTSVFLDIKP